MWSVSLTPCTFAALPVNSSITDFSVTIHSRLHQMYSSDVIWSIPDIPLLRPSVHCPIPFHWQFSEHRLDRFENTDVLDRTHSASVPAIFRFRHPLNYSVASMHHVTDLSVVYDRSDHLRQSEASYPAWSFRSLHIPVRVQTHVVRQYEKITSVPALLIHSNGEHYHELRSVMMNNRNGQCRVNLTMPEGHAGGNWGPKKHKESRRGGTNSSYWPNMKLTSKQWDFRDCDCITLNEGKESFRVTKIVS